MRDIYSQLAAAISVLSQNNNCGTRWRQFACYTGLYAASTAWTQSMARGAASDLVKSCLKANSLLY